MRVDKKIIDQPGLSYLKTRPKISVTSSSINREGKSQKRSKLKMLGIFLACLIFLGVGAFAAYLTSSAAPIFTDKSKSFAKQVGGILSMGQVKLIGESNGQINVLLLGIGGENHEGGYLSDSILLAQIRPEQKQVVTTSLPRDMIVDIPGLRGRKINAALAEGYLKNHDWNDGISLARAAVEEVTGQKIPYAAVLDFQGFSKLVDAIGGVEIDIPDSFTDYKYPDSKKGYIAPVTFTKGREKMNGQRALIYARSRHAQGHQGSDFARSRRQQQIIQAAKTRVLSSSILTSPTSLNKILQTVSEHIHTNLAPGELWRLWSQTKQVQTFGISLTPETGLICPTIQENTGAYILDVCQGKARGDIKQFFINAFTSAEVSKENPRILLAATNAFGPTAKKVSLQLENAGATVIGLNYTDIKPEESIYYQLTPKQNTGKYLKNELKTKEVALPPPGIKLDKEKYDIVIVLKDPSKEDANIIARQKAALPPPTIQETTGTEEETLSNEAKIEKENEDGDSQFPITNTQ